MSIQKIFPKTSIFSLLKIQDNYHSDNYHNFVRPNSVFSQNFEKRLSSSEIELLKKNGAYENQIKSGISYLNTNAAKIGEPFPDLPIVPKNSIDDTLNSKLLKDDLENINYYNKNLLESRLPFSINFQDSNKNPDDKGNSHNVINNKNKSYQIPHEARLISSLFKTNYIRGNNNISPHPKIKCLIPFNIPKSTESSLSKNKIKIEENTREDSNPEAKPFKKIQEKNQKNLSDGLDVLDYYLSFFHIKKIVVQNHFFDDIQRKIPNLGDSSDTFNFMKNMCKNIKIINEGEYNFIYNKEECIIFFNNCYEKVNELIFLKNKRKSSLDYDKFNSRYYNNVYNCNLSRKKKHPLKKNNKINNKKISSKNKRINKINNSKNGNYITVYLSQLQVNKKSLNIFPLCPRPTLVENIKVRFLEGIINEKYKIKLKKKINLIKDDGIFQCMKNKRFELIYQNDEKDVEFTMYINQLNILYLIYYYYSKIKENILLINKYHYSHASFSEIKAKINLIKKLIEKCNIIANEIYK